MAVATVNTTASNTTLDKAREIAEAIKRMADEYLNVSYSGSRIKTIEVVQPTPERIREMMEKLADYLNQLAQLATGRSKKSLDQKAEAFRKYAPIAAQAAEKLLKGVKPAELSDDEKKALLIYALAVRALATMKKSYSKEQNLTSIATITSVPNRAIAAAFRAELQVPSKAESTYASKPEMWLKYPRRFDLEGIDDNARSLIADAVRYEMGIRSRSRSYGAKPEFVLRQSGELDDVKYHFDVIIHFDKYADKLNPEAREYLLESLKRYSKLLEAIKNPDVLWNAITSLKDGLPLAEHYAKSAEETGRRGLASPRFIAYNYAWRLLSTFYMSSSLANRLGISLPGVRRSTYNALRRLLSEKLEERIKNIVKPGKMWHDLTDEEKRELARAVVDAVLDTLSYLGFSREDVMNAVDRIVGAAA